MTERKPPGITFESWIDKQIREAQERGEFDNLPGAGKPLPDLGKPYDEMRWVKQKLAREGLSSEELLPTPLKLRKEIHRLPETVRDLTSERAVRQVVDELNQRVMQWLRAPSGPQIPVGPANADEIVEQWRADRKAAQTAVTAPADHEASQAPSERVRWWRRLTRMRRRPG